MRKGGAVPGDSLGGLVTAGRAPSSTTVTDVDIWAPAPGPKGSPVRVLEFSYQRTFGWHQVVLHPNRCVTAYHRAYRHVKFK